MLKNHSFIPSDFARLIADHKQTKSLKNFNSVNQDLADEVELTEMVWYRRQDDKFEFKDYESLHAATVDYLLNNSSRLNATRLSQEPKIKSTNYHNLPTKGSRWQK